MKRLVYREWVLPLGIALLLWGTVFSMACRFEGNRYLTTGLAQSFIDRLLGASRIALSQSLFEQADLYFHQGVGYVRPQAFTNSVFVRAYDIIRPSAHAHASGYTISEILPWLQFATRMDPENVTAYLTMSYWLRDALRRPDLAEQVLLEAQRKNPYDYRVFNERARLAFQSQDDGKAGNLLDAALRTWPGREDPEDEQAVLDLAQILSRRAFLSQMTGDQEKAFFYFRKVLEVQPGHMAIARRVEAMEQGQDFSDLDRRTWEALFGGVSRHVNVCDHDHDHDCDHDHDEGHDCDHHHGHGKHECNHPSHRHTGCMTEGLH